MELLQLLAWLADQETKTQEQEALQTLAQQLESNQETIDKLDAYMNMQQNTISNLHNWILFLSIMLVMIAFSMAYQSWKDGKKLKVLDYKVNRIDKSIEKLEKKSGNQ